MDEREFVIGEYYWVQAGYGWQVVECVSVECYDGGIGFEETGVEGNPYQAKYISKAVHIPRPVDE